MDYFGAILNLLFPSQCPVCNSPSGNHSHNPLCNKCWSSMERYSGPSCSICGLPTLSHHTGLCSECIKTPPAFSRVLQFGIYEGALKQSIHLLKFSGIKRLAKPLSMLLLELPLDDYDGIVPVPLHPKRLREREFNQTALLGRRISRALKIPLLLNVLEKTRETKLQTEVSGKGRRANLRKAFSAHGNISGMRLLLVDDVITTGATARECSAVLKKAGAVDVQAVALARSMPKY